MTTVETIRESIANGVRRILARIAPIQGKAIKQVSVLAKQLIEEEK